MDPTDLLKPDLFNVPLVLGYIGPGAGFAFLGSFLILVSAFFLTLLAILTWPLRLLLRPLFRRGKKPTRPGALQRIVVVGLDGLDPKHVRRLMDSGLLPNFTRLAEMGIFSELATTCPPISPVAWSTFMTGVNPGKHNIFDFLNRDLRTYLPELSMARVNTVENPGIFNRKKSVYKLLRKSRPFWTILGEYGIFGTVLRVPVTFPPEPFYGASLSAMGVPDLRGTQGSFTFYTTVPAEYETDTDGRIIPVKRNGNHIETHLPGPSSPSRESVDEMAVPLRFRVDERNNAAEIHVSGRKFRIPVGAYSEWVNVVFEDTRFKKIVGICKFYLASVSPEFRLYVSPINIDPERPAMPISHPPYYSIYLGKLHGPFATLGLAEDTGALNAGVLEPAAFLEQVYAIHEEREKMFFDALARTRKGLCACVFDTPDRIQHMFRAPPLDGNEQGVENGVAKPGDVFDRMYRRMDQLIGRVLQHIDRETLLVVMSDHGIGPFYRGVNLNVWLKQEGYLFEIPDAGKSGYLRSVDWTRTLAYSFGLSGIYINKKGREAQGIVENDGEVSALKAELTEKLKGLRDPEKGETAILDVYDSLDIYAGPYRDNGPDLIPGFASGYRASWEAAVGRTDGSVFIDNKKAWGSDHCVDPSLVPGILFCNRKVKDNLIHIMDLAPTFLDLMGVPVPGYMDGKVLSFENSKEKS